MAPAGCRVRQTLHSKPSRAGTNGCRPCSPMQLIVRLAALPASAAMRRCRSAAQTRERPRSSAAWASRAATWPCSAPASGLGARPARNCSLRAASGIRARDVVGGVVRARPLLCRQLLCAGLSGERGVTRSKRRRGGGLDAACAGGLPSRCEGCIVVGLHPALACVAATWPRKASRHAQGPRPVRQAAALPAALHAEPAGTLSM